MQEGLVLDVHWYVRGCRHLLDPPALTVASDEALIALTDDPCLTSSVLLFNTTSNDYRATYLRMPALTTARTTAFMPALSPPDVRTASFILWVGVLVIAVDTMSRGDFVWWWMQNKKTIWQEIYRGPRLETPQDLL